MGPRISPDGRTMAFLAMVQDLTQVAVMSPDSGNWTILTRDRTLGEADTLCWSRDGSKIYYDRVAGVPKGIYTVPALGGEERLLLEDAAAPEALADGSLLVMRINAKRNPQAFRFWPDSGRLDPLGDPNLIWASGPSAASQPNGRLTPDGNAILFSARLDDKSATQHLYSLDLASNHLRQLAPSQVIKDSERVLIASDPSTRRIYVVLANNNTTRIVSLAPDGQGSPRLELALTEQVSGLDLSPAGDLYMGQTTAPEGLLRFTAAGGTPERLTSFSDFETFSILPLPGGAVMLSSAGSGRDRLLLFRPGKDPTNFLSSDEESSPPMVALGQKEAAFLAGSGTQRGLVIASLSDGRITTRLTATLGRTIASLAAAADGSELYYVASGEVWRIPVRGGEPRKLTSGDYIAADPRGKDLIVQRNEKDSAHLVRVSLADGSEHAIPYDGELRMIIAPTSLNSMAVGPDGRILLTVSPPDRWFYSAAILDPATGKMQKIPLEFQGDVDSPAWTADGHIVAGGDAERAGLWRFRREKP
jgi:hypothetical protein